MIEMNPCAIMWMTIDTLKPSSPDLGTCFISTRAEAEIDTLTLIINTKNHHLPPRAWGDGKHFANVLRGRKRPLLVPVPYVPLPDFSLKKKKNLKLKLLPKFLCKVFSPVPSSPLPALCFPFDHGLIWQGKSCSDLSQMPPQQCEGTFIPDSFSLGHIDWC